MVFVAVELLDSAPAVSRWNTVVKRLVANDSLFGRGDFRYSASGLHDAHIDDKENSRVNPEVALTTRRGTTLAKLATMDIDNLNSELVAFVPYSVVVCEGQHTLILPLGLQKTAGGYGCFTRGPTAGYAGKLEPQSPDGIVKGVLPLMLSAIRKVHPKMVLLTRFATRLGVTEETAWSSNKGLTAWSSAFPGTLRLGWLKYDRATDVYRPKPQEGAPDTYNPGGGGVIVRDDTLIAMDAAGRELLTVKHIDTIKPLEILLQPRFKEFLGILLSAYTATTDAFQDLCVRVSRLDRRLTKLDGGTGFAG
jgi:hypothetical protein